MKKLLLMSFMFVSVTAFSQTNLLSESFDDITTLPVSGWTETNQSIAGGSVPGWFQGNASVFTAYAGAGYIGANFNNTTAANTISNWLMSPVVSLQNGDIITFYSRSGGTYADRLQVILSTTGAASVAPSGGPSDLGSFTTELLDINPTLIATGYPITWTQYTVTLSGLASATDCKIALRYFVTDGGPAGTNSNYIGVDSFSVDRPLISASFTALNLKMYPNPATNNVTITSPDTKILKTEIIDLNGRVILSQTYSNLQDVNINITALQTGIYSLNIVTENGNGFTKLIKE